ncbi:hypothetical protein BDR26DRAFT_482057 [Obelidium mucronatum]|nr:hypothetical protein BDR26DRAFT_482057 [Obelidium mucronatum]
MRLLQWLLNRPNKTRMSSLRNSPINESSNQPRNTFSVFQFLTSPFFCFIYFGAYVFFVHNLYTGNIGGAVGETRKRPTLTQGEPIHRPLNSIRAELWGVWSLKVSSSSAASLNAIYSKEVPTRTLWLDLPTAQIDTLAIKERNEQILQVLASCWICCFMSRLLWRLPDELPLIMTNHCSLNRNRCCQTI